MRMPRSLFTALLCLALPVGLASAAPAQVSSLNNPTTVSGTLTGFRVLTGSGTYTSTAGTTAVCVGVQGGGGGGGGAAATSSGQSATGKGGGGGGYAYKCYFSGFDGATYSVGAAGTG